MTPHPAVAPRRVARAARRPAALARALAPALLPALWHCGAQAQLLGLDPAVGGGSGGAVASGAPATMGSAGGAVGPGLLGAASARSLRLTPRVALSETLTDNVNLTPTDRRAEAITQATAGVSFLSTGGRLRGFADYALTGIHYARGSASSRLQNTLSAALTAELYERRAFVDVSANISQQSTSAFGTQAADPALANANRTEVRSYRVSPYLRGALANVAVYDLRLARAATHVASSSAANVVTTTTSLLLTGIGGGYVNWTADASHQTVDYAVGSRREADRAGGTLLFTPLPELRLALIGGVESNNFVSADKTTRSVYGARLNWTPTPRTAFLAERQQRYFGSSHALTLTHRLARSLLSASDVKDVLVDSAQDLSGVRTTLFDVFFAAYQRLYPDPAVRTTEVLRFLALNNLNPQALLSSATSVRRAQQISYGWSGLRDSLTLQASRTDTQRIDTRLTLGAGDLAASSRVRQQGLALTLAHRLTPLSNLSLSLSQQRNFGDASTTGAAAQETRLRSGLVNWTTRLNPRATASLSARHSRFESTTSAYRESAVTANLNLTF